MHSTRESGLRRCAMSPPSSSGAQPAMTATSPVEQQSPPYANPSTPALLRSHAPKPCERRDRGAAVLPLRYSEAGESLRRRFGGLRRLALQLDHDHIERLIAGVFRQMSRCGAVLHI